MENVVKSKQNKLSRLSKKAKYSIRNAGIIAKHFKSKKITPEYILVGILLSSDCLARKVIDSMNISIDSVIGEILKGSNVEITGKKGALEVNLDIQSQEILRKAYNWSLKLRHVYVGTEHIILAILSSDLDVVKRLESKGLNIKNFRTKLREYAMYPQGILVDSDMDSPVPGAQRESYIDTVGIDLVKLAREGRLDPVIGREEELDSVIKILSRRNKNNPLVVGEAGVGKTVLVEGLAQRIADGRVPPSLRDMRVISLDVGSIVAGSRMRGDVEDKVLSIVSEVVASNNTILFIDEIHNTLSSSMMSGSPDIASILKPALLKDDFRCIGATTIEDYSMYIEDDNALARRFQPVFLEESSIGDTVEILKNVKPILEAHHSINISMEAITEGVKLADRYITNRFLPDKAIDLIDEAAATKRILVEKEYSGISELIAKYRSLVNAKEESINRGLMEKAVDLDIETKALLRKIKAEEQKCEKSKKSLDNEVNLSDVREVVSRWTGIPLNTLGSKEVESLLGLEKRLASKVIGQNEAVEAVCKAIKRARVGISDSQRPWASFLFLGPTGVGKTELAKILSKDLFGNEDRLIQIDMSEMMEMHSVSKLIGSPPGYVGYREGGRLTEEVRKHPHSIILFDEIEKAHSDVLNILLQILEYGHLTDGKGRKVNFKNTIIILTSNIGAEEISKDKILGFVGKSGVRSDSEIDDAYDSMKETLTNELKNSLRPELINRLDDIVIFRSLNRKDARKIVKILVEELNERLNEQGIDISLESKLITYLVSKGFSDEYGARPLRRLIQDSVENVLAEYIIKNTVNDEGVKNIKLGLDKDRVVVI